MTVNGEFQGLFPVPQQTDSRPLHPVMAGGASALLASDNRIVRAPLFEEPVSVIETGLTPTHPHVVMALREITDAETTKVYGFGELHVRASEAALRLRIPSAMEHFASEIVPFLVIERGVTVIGDESLPCNIDDEVGAFMESGIISKEKTRVLNAWLTIDDDAEGTKRLLNTVRDLRRKGYRVSLKGLYDTWENFIRVGQGDASRETLIAQINQNVLELIRGGLATGQKVAVYTGGAHCSVAPAESARHISYVPGLESAGLRMDEFAEVQLRVPEYLDEEEGELNTLIHQYAPRSGVFVLRYGPRSHVINFPRS